ncbi:MAG: thioredoxin [Candidatus Omnitrophota bacterium]|nr:thioredoxin [Candidatus Omnitrophota bacterium]
MSILHLTDANFKKEVLESDLPVLVDFWAQWCAPCKKIAPALDELAKEYDKKIRIAKFDVDGNSKTATHYGVMSIPTLIFFKHGKVADQVTGALSKAELKLRIEESIK